MTNVYETKDFYCAGFLISEGVKLISHRRNGTITTFCFDNDDLLKQLIQKYYAMQAAVEPMTYSNALRTLKSVLYSGNDANANIKVYKNVQHYKEIKQQ
jgi:hypothetical protein